MFVIGTFHDLFLSSDRSIKDEKFIKCTLLRKKLLKNFKHVWRILLSLPYESFIYRKNPRSPFSKTQRFGKLFPLLKSFLLKEEGKGMLV